MALLAMLALLVNIALPAATLRALPSLDIFASAICHNGSKGEQPDKPLQKQACPVCTLVAGQAHALPLGGEAATLPVPSTHPLPEARAPPAPAPRTAPPVAHPARGPPAFA